MYSQGMLTLPPHMNYFYEIFLKLTKHYQIGSILSSSKKGDPCIINVGLRQK